MKQNLEQLASFRERINKWRTESGPALRATLDLLERLCEVGVRSDLPPEELARVARDKYAAGFRVPHTEIRAWSGNDSNQQPFLLPQFDEMLVSSPSTSWIQEYKALVRLFREIPPDDAHAAALLAWTYEALLHLDRTERKVAEPKHPEWPECGVAFYFTEKRGGKIARKARVGYLRLMPLPFAGALLVEGVFLHRHRPEKHSNGPDVDLRQAVRDAATAAGFFERKRAYSWWIEMIDEEGREVPLSGIDLSGDSLGGAAAVLFTLLGGCPRNCVVSTTCREDGVLGSVGFAHEKTEIVLGAYDRNRGDRPRVTRFVLSNAQSLTPDELEDSRVEVPKTDTLKDLVELVHAETRALNAWCEHLIRLPEHKEGLPRYYMFEGRPEETRSRAELFQKPMLQEMAEPPKKNKAEDDSFDQEKSAPIRSISDGMPPGLLVDAPVILRFDALVGELLLPEDQGYPHQIVVAPSGYGKSLMAMMLAREFARAAQANTADSGIYSAIIPIPIRLGSLKIGDSVTAMIDAAISQPFVPGLPSASNILHQDELRNRLGQVVESGRAVFLLDGLDENGTDHGCVILEGILSVVPSPHIILLTRFYGLSVELLNRFRNINKTTESDVHKRLTARCWRIQDLTGEQAKELFGAYYRGHVPAHAEAILARMRESIYMREVLRSGLLLTFVFHLISCGEEIQPHITLAELYERILNLILKYPARTKNDAWERRPREVSNLRSRLLNACLAPFFFAPAASNLKKADMENALVSFGKDRSDAEELLEKSLSELSDSGLLVPLPGTDGKIVTPAERYAFSHKSFLDYLAARAIAEVLTDPKNSENGWNSRITLGTIQRLNGTHEQTFETATVSLRPLVFECCLLHEGCHGLLLFLNDCLLEQRDLYSEWDAFLANVFFSKFDNRQFLPQSKDWTNEMVTTAVRISLTIMQKIKEEYPLYFKSDSVSDWMNTAIVPNLPTEPPKPLLEGSIWDKAIKAIKGQELEQTRAKETKSSKSETPSRWKIQREAACNLAKTKGLSKNARERLLKEATLWISDIYQNGRIDFSKNPSKKSLIFTLRASLP